MSDRITNACQGCTERHVGCHCDCERYAAFRESIDTINTARRREKEADSYFRTKESKKREAMGKYEKRNKGRSFPHG